jgi:hypothetical protein
MHVRPLLPMLVLLASAAGTQALRAQARLEAAPLVPPFSAQKSSLSPPPQWESIQITPGKTPTEYRLVSDAGTVVLRARAQAAASGLGYTTDFDIRAAPVIEWRWKVSRLIANADNAVAAREDSPARIVLEFDGDKTRLSLRERAFFLLGQQLSGRDVPYATLMYIYALRAPVGTLIANPRTGRVQMIVASSGRDDIGRWQTLRRDVLADYRRAFGEEPGKLIAVGVLTDTDNTGEYAEAWYGDIRFDAEPL